jgi:hypothetical protein
MKKISNAQQTIISLLLLVTMITSCAKEKETITPSVLVKETCCSPIYYAEILHKDMYKVGDTIRIIYNQMPKHELAYPSSRRYQYTTVVIINK